MSGSVAERFGALVEEIVREMNSIQVRSIEKFDPEDQEIAFETLQPCLTLARAVRKEIDALVWGQES